MTTQTTPEELRHLARRFSFNRTFLNTLIDGFQADDWSRVPSDQGGNTPHWILGHLVTSRRFLARRLGAELPNDGWEELFGMHAEPDGTRGFPSVPELVTAFGAADAALAERLPALTEEEREEPWGARPFPDGGETVAQGVSFLYFHETYHLGQLGLLRRILGKPGFA